MTTARYSGLLAGNTADVAYYVPVLDFGSAGQHALGAIRTNDTKGFQDAIRQAKEHHSDVRSGKAQLKVYGLGVGGNKDNMHDRLNLDAQEQKKMNDVVQSIINPAPVQSTFRPRVTAMGGPV